MTEDDDIDGLAAEYVLGSLDAAERAAVDARRRTDASLSAAIEAWQRRLAPLSEQAPGVEPPPHLLERVLSRIAASEGQRSGTAQIIPFRLRAGRRLRFSVGAGALAACLALVQVWRTHEDTLPGHKPGIDVAQMGCGGRYKNFWETFEHQKYARMSAEQLAGVSRMALRAYDACEAGDDQDAKALFERLKRMSF
jgi:anti-sigma-K factor RskA